MAHLFNKKNWYLGGTLFLTSCAVSMPCDRQTVNLLPPPSLECSIEKSLESPYFSIGEWPQRNWWEIFQSPLLNAWIEQALADNPSLKEVEQRVTFAAYQAIIARSKLFPSVYFNAMDTWDHLSSNGIYKALNPKIPLNANLMELNISLYYEFDFWGKNANLFKAAIGRELAQEAEVAQVELTVSTTLATAFFALKSNLLLKKHYERLISIRNKTLELQRKLKIGSLYSTIPPLLLDETIFEVNKLLAAIDLDIAENKHFINVLMGYSPDAPLVVDDCLPPLPPRIAVPCDLSLNLLARRPDLMAQIWRAKSLAFEVGAAIADFYPNINLYAFAGLESLVFSRLFTPGSATVEIQPALSLPIFTAGRIGANVRSGTSAFDEAIFGYNRLLLTSAQEVADFLALAKSLYEQKEQQEKIIESVKKRFELSLIRKKTGLDSLLNNYAVEDELVLREIDNVKLLFSQYEAMIKLIKALGGGYCNDYIPLYVQGFCVQ